MRDDDNDNNEEKELSGTIVQEKTANDEQLKVLQKILQKILETLFHSLNSYHLHRPGSDDLDQ